MGQFIKIESDYCNENYIFAQKSWGPKMGSAIIIGHRIDYNGAGALEGQWHIPSKN